VNLFLIFESDICRVLKLGRFDDVRAGECHVSPAVLASMWREEETKCKNLEEKMKAMLKGKGVCTGSHCK